MINDVNVRLLPGSRYAQGRHRGDRQRNLQWLAVNAQCEHARNLIALRHLLQDGAGSGTEAIRTARAGRQTRHGLGVHHPTLNAGRDSVEYRLAARQL